MTSLQNGPFGSSVSVISLSGPTTSSGSSESVAWISADYLLELLVHWLNSKFLTYQMLSKDRLSPLKLLSIHATDSLEPELVVGPESEITGCIWMAMKMQ